MAEEAAVTAEIMGNPVDRLFDVGVAGLHRLLSAGDRSKPPRHRRGRGHGRGPAERGGGLVRTPVIAVPTSVGYGASFGGIAACWHAELVRPGVTVVNIDNGFGAGYAASQINKFFFFF